MTRTTMSQPLIYSIILLFALSPNPVASEVVLESGYSVSTVIDFNKHSNPSSLHPFALLPRHRSPHAILLDSTNSAFYSIPIPISQESEVAILSGKGVAGFADGDKAAALFDRPRGFALDGKDNVYVADRLNRAIRKISTSGVTTTIAGGYSEKTGHVDGPAQNASFSNDFDLVYVPTICALLISDRGNRLIRQLELKPEDCAQKTQAGLGVIPISGIAVLCLLFGLVLGFVARPFFATRVSPLDSPNSLVLLPRMLIQLLPRVCRQEKFTNHFINKTWKHYRINLGRLVLTTYPVIRSAVANSTIFHLIPRLVNLGLCYISIVFRNIRLERRVQYGSKKTPLKASSVYREPVSLLESDMVSNQDVQKPQHFADQLPDLISFDEGMGVLGVNRSSEQQHETQNASEGNCCKMDDMINSNLLDFGSQPKEQVHTEGSAAYCPGLVQRRPMRVEGL